MGGMSIFTMAMTVPQAWAVWAVVAGVHVNG